MKKILVVIGFVALLLVGCSKEDSEKNLIQKDGESIFACYCMDKELDPFIMNSFASVAISLL